MFWRLTRGRVVAAVAILQPEAELRAHDAAHRSIELAFVEVAGVHASRQTPEVQAARHLDVESGAHAGGVVVRPDDPIGLHETLKAPLVLEDVLQQWRGEVAVEAVDLVVRAHHRRDVRVLHGAAEVREVDLAQRALVDGHVHHVPGVFDAVRREVLGAGEHSLRLHALDERHAHRAQMSDVFGVGLLRAPPERVAKDVDRRREEHVGAGRALFTRHRRTHAALEPHVEGRATHHRDGERGSVLVRDAAQPTRAIEHVQPRDPLSCVALHLPRSVDREEPHAVHHGGLLRDRQRAQQLGDARLDRFRFGAGKRAVRECLFGRLEGLGLVDAWRVHADIGRVRSVHWGIDATVRESRVVTTSAKQRHQDQYPHPLTLATF